MLSFSMSIATTATAVVCAENFSCPILEDHIQLSRILSHDLLLHHPIQYAGGNAIEKSPSGIPIGSTLSFLTHPIYIKVTGNKVSAVFLVYTITAILAFNNSYFKTVIFIRGSSFRKDC